MLPNNANVILARRAGGRARAEAGARRADALDAGRARGAGRLRPGASADENAAAMREAVDAVATGAVTVASRDVELERRSPSARASGSASPTARRSPAAASFDEVAGPSLERLLAEPRERADAAHRRRRRRRSTACSSGLAEQHPELEIEVQDGGQPHYPLLLSAE